MAPAGDRHGTPDEDRLQAKFSIGYAAATALLDGEVEVRAGSGAAAPNDAEFGTKLADCLSGLDTDPDDWTWGTAPALLRALLKSRRSITSAEDNDGRAQ